MAKLKASIKRVKIGSKFYWTVEGGSTGPAFVNPNTKAEADLRRRARQRKLDSGIRSNQ